MATKLKITTSVVGLDLLQKRTLIKLVISSAYSDGENLILNLTGTRESAKMTEFPLGDNCK